MDVLLATQKTVTTECPECSDGSIELAVLIPARATDAEPRYEWSSDACPACGGSGWVTVIACVACGLSVGECSCDEGVLEAWLAGRRASLAAFDEDDDAEAAEWARGGRP